MRKRGGSRSQEQAFDDLLRRPFRRGMASDLDMQDLAVGMTDRKEDIEGLEPDRPHTEEITGPDILRMSPEYHRLTWIQNSRSARSNRGRGCRRWRTMSCCRKHKFSATNSA